MGRNYVALIRTVATIAVAASSGCSAPSPTLGEPANGPIAAPTQARAALVLAFAEEDCFNCTMPTYRLRQLQRQYGDRLDLVGTMIGADSALARRFFQEARLDITLRVISPEHAHQQFGDMPTPSIFLVWRDTVRGIALGAHTDTREAAGEFDLIFTRVMAEAGAQDK